MQSCIGVGSSMWRSPTKQNKAFDSLRVRQLFVVGDVKAGIGIKEKDNVLSRGLKKKRRRRINSAHLWMKRPGPFSLCGVFPAARETRPAFWEWVSWKAALSRPHCSACASAITCISTCLQGEDATHGAEWGREGGTEEACWELQLVFQSCCFCCLWLCSRACVCVACATGVIEAKEEKAKSSFLETLATKKWNVDERLHNLIVLLKAYVFIMRLIKLIERIIEIHLRLHLSSFIGFLWSVVMIVT